MEKNNQEQQNNLMQEEFYFKELNPTKVPDHVESHLNNFIYSFEFSSEETVLRKFGIWYVFLCLVFLSFFHQLGAGFFQFSITSILNPIGPILKEFISSVCFMSCVTALSLLLGFNKTDAESLLTLQQKSIYVISIFTWFFLNLFGQSFAWSTSISWLIGGIIGTNIGLSFGFRYLNAADTSKNEQS